MLKSLLIKNYALIDQLSVNFTDGLVIITGETGAGKSILVDALGLVIGARASTEVVRAGTEKAVVEAVFDISGNNKVKTLLEENSLSSAEEAIVRREISAKGQNRCFVNDSPTSLNLLKQVGELLVDLHGQHEHQSLLRVSTHIEMLDEFGLLQEMVGECRASYASLMDSARALFNLRKREAELRTKRELIDFQVQEIDAVNPRLGEEEEIEAELKILENAERLHEASSKLYEVLYETEHSVHDRLVIARNQLTQLAAIDKHFEELATECSSAEAIISEVAKSLQRYGSQIEFNPQRLEQLRERLGRLTLLKKKYGGSLESTVAHRSRIGEELSLAENFDHEAVKLTEEIERRRSSCARIAHDLAVRRREVTKKLDEALVVELSKLGIQNAKFTTRVRDLDFQHPDEPGSFESASFVKVGKKLLRLTPSGYDDVEFFISTNLGEDVKPLAKVASGGEISRIMLALKSILAKADRLPVLIFDEIDVGVSGKIAQAVGMSLKNLSAFHQIIAITHLPQIAGLADVHFSVVKSEEGGRTITSIHELSLEERVREVAKLMSGEEVTEAGLKGARELMSASKK